MDANVLWRKTATSDTPAPYYRLKQSYRDKDGHIRTPTLLHIGYDSEVTPQQARRIARALTLRLKSGGQATLFDPLDDRTAAERAKAEEWWARLLAEEQRKRGDASQTAGHS